MCILIRLPLLFVYIGLTAYCMSAGSVTLLSHVIKAQMHIQKLPGFSKTNKNIAALSIGGPLLSLQPIALCRQFSLIRNYCTGPKSNKERSRARLVLCVIRRVRVSLGTRGRYLQPDSSLASGSCIDIQKMSCCRFMITK